jgi:integrase
MKGHIRERSPGKWAIILDAKDAAGRRKRRWHSFAGTKWAAQIECARLIAEMQHGTAVDPNRIMVGQYLDRFLEDWAPLHITAGSVRRYGEVLAHVRRHLGDRRLQAIRPGDISGLYAALVRQGLTPRTIKLVHSVLMRALKQAKMWGLLRDNPAEMVKPPKIQNRETDILQPDQARRLLKALHGKPLYLIASLALGTGMRRNEMLALRWSDLDLDANALTIETALEGNSTRVKRPKTKHSRRTISLPPHIVTELRGHWKAQQEQRLTLGMGRTPDDGYVFATFDGKAPSPNAVTKAWPVAMKSIGMPAISLHSLRHVHASMLIASGMDILTISRRLGHSTPTVTLGVYGHLIHGADDRAAQVMAAAFGKVIG